MALELLGGLVAEELHGIAAVDEGKPLGQQAFELDRTDFRAVLLLLAALLGVFIGIELALHAVGGAVEQAHRRPQQAVEVGFEAGIAERGDQGVEDIRYGAADGGGFGQGPRIGLVPTGPIAVERKFGEDLVGRR